jgi:hypothetical protein
MYTDTVTATIPHGSRRRRTLDGLIKYVDILIGVVVFSSGVFAFIATPPTVLREVQIPALVPLWASLLCLGGLAAVGRVTGIWLIEVTGLAAGFFGIAGYLIVVTSVVADQLGVAVACGLIFGTMLTMLRRWLELQQFTHEENLEGFVVQFNALVRRRTTSRHK